MNAHVATDTGLIDAGIVRLALIELAALIPNPSDPIEGEWPCENPADRRCLQAAYEMLRSALFAKKLHD